MALTKQDILDTLASDHVAALDFQLSTARVSMLNYNRVRARIEDGRIQVIGGMYPTAVRYHSDSNVLEIQSNVSPADIDDRALLVNECTHAIVNLEQCAITQLTSEVLGYIAQHVYLMVADPFYEVRANDAPYCRFFKNVVALIRKFKLHQPEGRGTTLKLTDYFALRSELSKLGPYRGIGFLDMAAGARTAPPPLVRTLFGQEACPEAGSGFSPVRARTYALPGMILSRVTASENGGAGMRSCGSDA